MIYHCVKTFWSVKAMYGFSRNRGLSWELGWCGLKNIIFVS